jgi:hypothetical protein
MTAHKTQENQMTVEQEMKECPVCHKQTDYLIPFYDRHNCYSGRACSDKCGDTLPGQGAMRNYEAEEPIEEDNW